MTYFRIKNKVFSPKEVKGQLSNFSWCQNTCNHFIKVWGTSVVRFKSQSLKAGYQHLIYGLWFTNECTVPTYLMFMTGLHKMKWEHMETARYLMRLLKCWPNCVVLCFSPFFKCEQISFVNRKIRSYHLCYAVTRLEKYISLQYKYELHSQQDSMFFSFLHWLHVVGITTNVQPG